MLKNKIRGKITLIDSSWKKIKHFIKEIKRKNN